MNKELIVDELVFKAVRSSGPGGQHVNKVSTKIEIAFDLESSKALSFTEKERLNQKLRSRISKEGVLLLQCDESRSQLKNKELVVDKLFGLLENALVVRKKRIRTKPTKSAMEKRLRAKKKNAAKKVDRGKRHTE